jgi:signal peptidase I
MFDVAPAAKPTLSSDDKLSSFDSFRETVESIAVAFMLAFIFKTFLVEAFVIPTGSMAPTLMGQHRDITCPQCKHQYRFGFGTRSANATPTCPNCDFRIMQLGPEYPVYSGDRILVNKFLYDFDPPQRWDVIVFKYPEDAKTNYIKRLVGLPGEQLAIRHGDIFTTKLENNVPVGSEDIARKPNHKKLQAMLQEVYDNDDLFEGFIERGWPLRWQDWSAANQPAVWQTEQGGRQYSVAQATAENAWLRYQHFLPRPIDWGQYLGRPQEKFTDVVPRLIMDEYAYNDSPGNDWVGDIALETEIATTGDGGEVTLELIKGGKAFRTILDLKEGTARLEIPDLPDFKAEPVKIGWRGAGKHHVMFANVDRQLWLLIDGAPVFDTAASIYPDMQNNIPAGKVLERGEQFASDYSPIGIAVRGTAATVNHLRILRDVYYINHEEHRRIHGEYYEQHGIQGPIRLLDFPDDDLDQFLMLGDNSPSSSDSRYWKKQSFVQRRHLIGKAIYVFWPHAWDFDWSFEIPLGPLSFKFPFYPNFKRMTLIR